MRVEIDPRDVVSVPKDCDCQKLRTCKYKVVALHETIEKPLDEGIYGEYDEHDEYYDEYLEEQDYENMIAKSDNWHHVRVDCDKAPTVKRYFDARVEPQFLFLVNGGEIKRTIGYNFVKLENQLKEVENAHNNDINYYGNSKHTWERFYDEFDRFARYGESDRDGFRAYLEP